MHKFAWWPGKLLKHINTDMTFVIKLLTQFNKQIINQTPPLLFIFFCVLFLSYLIWTWLNICRTVHLCIRLSDRKQVIIKQIPVEQITKDERQAALNEVKVLSMLHHPNIILYFENFLEDKALMIVMEYAQGEISVKCVDIFSIWRFWNSCQ